MAIVGSFSSRAHAEVAASMLAAHDVTAAVTGDDAGGTAPHVALGAGGGWAISVPDDQRDLAAHLLAATAPVDDEPIDLADRTAPVRRVLRFVVALVLLLVVVSVLTGCAGVRERPVGETEAAVLIHTRQLPRGGNAALVGGRLVVDGDCVLLDQERGDGTRFPVVWPFGTEVVGDDPLVLALPSGTRLEEGGTVTGGGGYLSPAAAGVEVPSSCLDVHGEVAVFNPDDDPVLGDPEGLVGDAG